MATLPGYYYQNPNAGLTKSVGELAKAFLSGPSVYEKDYLAARADAARARAEKDRAEAGATINTLDARDGISDIFRRAPNMEAPRVPEVPIGPMPQATPEQAFQMMKPDIASNAVSIAGNKPDTAGSIARMVAGLLGVEPGTMANVMMGAGDKYADTQPGFEMAEKNDLAQAFGVQRLRNVGDVAVENAKPVNAGAGDTVFLPDGHPLAGSSPLYGRDTKSIVEGAILAALGEEDQRVAALGQSAYGATESQAKGEAFGNLPSDRQALAVGPSETNVKGDILATDAPDYTDAERKNITGATPSGASTPRNYLTPDGSRGTTLDGVTDAAGGGPLPQGTQVYSNVANDTPQSTIAKQIDTDKSRARFKALVSYTRDLANKDPMNFGFPGFVKGKVQDVNALLKGVSDAFGYDNPDKALADIRNRAMSSGDVSADVFNTMFDHNLPKLQTAANLLTFAAAEALANQEGRSISDRDIQMMSKVIGNPGDIFSSQERFLSKLQAAEEIVNAYQNADGAAGKPGDVQKWKRGPDGKPVPDGG